MALVQSLKRQRNTCFSGFIYVKFRESQSQLKSPCEHPTRWRASDLLPASSEPHPSSNVHSTNGNDAECQWTLHTPLGLWDTCTTEFICNREEKSAQRMLRTVVAFRGCTEAAESALYYLGFRLGCGNSQREFSLPWGELMAYQS